MTPGEIERLSQAARRAGLAEVEVDDGPLSLRLRLASKPRQSGASADQPAEPSPPRGIRSPGVGRFHHRHPLTGRPACEAGRRVSRGQIVGYLVAGPCVQPVAAPENGTIGAPAHPEGAIAGYGTLLYPLG